MGFSTWSITMTSTGPLKGARRSPRPWIAVKIGGPVASAGGTSLPLLGWLSSGSHSSRKLNALDTGFVEDGTAEFAFQKAGERCHRGPATFDQAFIDRNSAGVGIRAGISAISVRFWRFRD